MGAIFDVLSSGGNSFPTQWYTPLTFQNRSSEVCTFRLDMRVGSQAAEEPDPSGLRFRVNGGSWRVFTPTKPRYDSAGQFDSDATKWGTLISLGYKDTVQFYNSGNEFSKYYGGFFAALAGAESSYRFVMEGGSVYASGNIMSLMNYSGQCQPYCFAGLFYSCDVLKTPPAMPALELAESCYESTFHRCSALTEPPELPATELKLRCYGGMFYLCEKLTGCVLPAEKLAKESYSGMFYGCSKISRIEVNFTEWSGNYVNDEGKVFTDSTSWVENCAAKGTFVKPAALPEVFSTNCIPEGWTVINKDG